MELLLREQDKFPVTCKDPAITSVYMDMATRQTQFEALVNAYSADLYRYAYWLCQRPDLAEDLVQETFARAWKALGSLNDFNAAKGWLITILRRENARYHNKYRHEKTHSRIDDMEIDTLELSEPRVSASEQLILREALAQLPEDYREPLLMQVIGGYSSTEIAEHMDITPGAVMTRLFRARQAMRKLLQDDNLEQLSEKV
ncbi:MAG: sigma-70 family RNA polymerase sigma factor [Gammaproteobacteria bacterium]|nr:MAG: sigma-70 family RNA polymerase sigma factor [Gammaproteobacteria bacterium]